MNWPNMSGLLWRRARQMMRERYVMLLRRLDIWRLSLSSMKQSVAMTEISL